MPQFPFLQCQNRLIRQFHTVRRRRQAHLQILRLLLHKFHKSRKTSLSFRSLFSLPSLLFFSLLSLPSWLSFSHRFIVFGVSRSGIYAFFCLRDAKISSKLTEQIIRDSSFPFLFCGFFFICSFLSASFSTDSFRQTLFGRPFFGDPFRNRIYGRLFHCFIDIFFLSASISATAFRQLFQLFQSPEHYYRFHFLYAFSPFIL